MLAVERQIIRVRQGTEKKNRSRETQYTTETAVRTHSSSLYPFQVSPPFDSSGVTSLVAANFLFEMLCVLPDVLYKAKAF